MQTSRISSRSIALAIIFAVLYFALRSLPILPMIGISGRFTAGDFLLTTIALVGGLRVGILSVFVGTILAYTVGGTAFLGLDFFPGVVNVFIVGLVVGRRLGLACLTYVTILLVLLASPYSLLFGFDHIPYVWLHILALAILLSPLMTRIPVWLTSDSGRQIVAIGVLAFVGTMAQHLAGNLLFELVLGLVQGSSPAFFMNIWRATFYIYPGERLIITIMSTIMSIALVRPLQRLRI
jgi:hypothetical protein